MNQEDKELSFIDISGRLHYGVMVNYKEYEYDHREWKVTSLYTLSYSKSGTLIDTDYDGWISYEEYKGCGMSTGSRPFRFGEVLPYLRPMSLMTEEEMKEYYTFQYKFTFQTHEHQELNKETFSEYLDWLNAHHFDFRNLIERGLAIEVTEENNPYKK